MNAKQEFLAHTQEHNVKCAIVQINDNLKLNTIRLRQNHSFIEMDNFLNQLNFEYSSDYGLQYLLGIIWYNDGTWSIRGEYDGSEWWQYQYCPVIPKELL